LARENFGDDGSLGNISEWPLLGAERTINRCSATGFCALRNFPKVILIVS
jgi:hypothetical protein